MTNDAIMLGRRPDTPDKSRPMKITFKSENDKWTFLKRLNSIKPNNTYGKLDPTQQERALEKQLVEKLKELRQGRTDANLKIKNWAVQEVLSNGKMKLVYKLPTQTLDQ
jgi:hypothetical protein